MDTATILDRIISHAQASGWFERVNGHEPKGPPSVSGLTAAVWVDAIDPVPAGSGLAATTARLTVHVRVYTSMLSEPQDAIDPNLMSVVDALLSAYSGDFELGGQVRNVDLLGQTGPGLSAKAGYLTVGSTMFRVVTVLLPLIVSDVWVQSP